MRRTVYNYYTNGKLLGEMHYNYPKDREPVSRKVVYHYDSPVQALTKKESYSPNNYLTSKELSYYNDNNKLIKNETRSKVNGEDHIQLSKDVAYDKNGLIKKSISRVYDANKNTVIRETNIYKDGRLIYRRVDDAKGFLFESNFQYLTK